MGPPPRDRGRPSQRRRGGPADGARSSSGATSGSGRSTSRSAGPNGSPSSVRTAPARPRSSTSLLGRLEPSAGERWLGPGVVVGEMEQRRSQFATSDPLLDVVTGASGLLARDARSLLAKFGLTADHVARPADTLSPGERTRAGLALFMARGVNFICLDEPTNHLDLPAIEQLEQALDTFEGTRPAGHPRSSPARRRAPGPAPARRPRDRARSLTGRRRVECRVREERCRPAAARPARPASRRCGAGGHRP